MRLHHIGYLVKKIDKSLKAFESLGYKALSLCGGKDVVYDEFRQCDISFMKHPQGEEMYIELIAPKTPEAPIWGLMRTYKNAPYHCCYESENLDAEIDRLRAEGWTMFQPPAPAPAIAGRRVAFLVHRNAGIIELVEKVD